MVSKNLNFIYKISNLSLFKRQSKDIIDLEIDSIYIDNDENIETNLLIYKNVDFNVDISNQIYEYFSNSSRFNTADFIKNIIRVLNNNKHIYLDYSHINFEEKDLKLFKTIFLFAVSLFHHVSLGDNIYNKLNIDNDLHYYIKDLIVFRKNVDYSTDPKVEVLVSKDGVLIYKIGSIHYLYNTNPNPVKFELPITMQNKVYYSLICNNEKHLHDNLIIGKHNFFVFEELD